MGTPPKYGASDEARTRYLHLGKVALYQMSYTRNDKGYDIRRKSFCQGRNEKSVERQTLLAAETPHTRVRAWKQRHRLTEKGRFP